jgi:poly(3-hydroxybutyrate) depolymerase
MAADVQTTPAKTEKNSPGDQVKPVESLPTVAEQASKTLGDHADALLKSGPVSKTTEASKNNAAANEILGTAAIIGADSPNVKANDGARIIDSKDNKEIQGVSPTSAVASEMSNRVTERAAGDATNNATSDATAMLNGMSLTDSSLAAMGAHEVITDSAGNEKLVPLEKLQPGDHTIALEDGREFMMHIPPNDGKQQLPVMFVFSGSAESQWNIKDFMPESGMNTKADSPDHKFIAVYPLPEKHLLGVGSKEAAYGWNVLDPKGGTLIDRQDSVKAGYDDSKFVEDIAKLLPQVANVDATHKDWAAVGFSQGGIFLNYLVAKEPNLFPTVALVGSGMDPNFKYDVQPGNAKNVAIVNLRGDKETIPFHDNVDMHYREEEALKAVLPKSIFEGLDNLAAIDNMSADPQLQMNTYFKQLGHTHSDVLDLNEPIKSDDKAVVMQSTDPGNKNILEIIDLATAKHSYPEPDPSGKRTNAQDKYTGLDTDQKIVDMWMKYNKSLTD